MCVLGPHPEPGMLTHSLPLPLSDSILPLLPSLSVCVNVHRRLASIYTFSNCRDSLLLLFVGGWEAGVCLHEGGFELKRCKMLGQFGEGEKA